MNTKLNKLTLLPIIASSASALTLQAVAQTPAATQRPNIIYILADDMGIGDLGCYGQEKIQTPTIDALAANGLQFSRHYSGSTVSAPSRCCLMTGKHTGHSYVRGNRQETPETDDHFDFPMDAHEITVAEILQSQGYRTGCVGKWGLGGPSTPGSPNNQGFEYFFGYLSQIQAHRYYPDYLWENNTRIALDKKAYSHDLIVDKGIDFIHKNAHESFFLYMPITLPHADLAVPEQNRITYEDRFIETPFAGNNYSPQEKPKATYAAMIGKIDQTVSRVLKQLDEEGIRENTIVIFSSDNGVHSVGGHEPDFFRSNGGFRGYKRDLYEGGVRTPLIISWPCVIDSHRVTPLISAFWDFLPTICDLLGSSVPDGIDGLSILPEITGKGKQEQHDCLYWEFYEKGGKQAVLKGNWKLIHLFVGHPSKETWELYDLTNDPTECMNLYDQYPEKVKELKALIKKNHTPSSHYSFIKHKPARNKK